MLSYARPVHGYHSLASGHGLPYVCRRSVIVHPGRIYINYVSFPRLGLLCKWLCTVASDVSDRVCAHRLDASRSPFNVQRARICRRPPWVSRREIDRVFSFDDELKICRGSFTGDLRILGYSSTRIVDREDPHGYRGRIQRAQRVIAGRLMRGGWEFVGARWKSLGVTSLHKYCNAANIVANCYICIRM